MKLRKHLARRRNAPRWNMIPFLSAHDLDEELHELVSFTEVAVQNGKLQNLMTSSLQGRRLASDLLHGLDDSELCGRSMSFCLLTI